MATPAQHFALATVAVADRLPFGLARVVPASLVGFVAINTTTFAVDIGCLTAAHGGLGWPLPAAVSVGYAIAFTLGYVLNRVLNFRSEADVGPQLSVYVALVVVNYLVWVLGTVTLLSSLGLDYRLARVASGACETVYLYAALRWIVFRDQEPRARPDRP